ncbi:hypothetical protein LOC54_01825 [Acetobacter sp. AN02]|uniref:hypothetical protein n=1 Tax=Acetobacter sp. AN02 TaxID=2894186 RepID=UPI002434618F|nr:hypothetical protein [Acetobacter sp. AN02]MDG6093862.1 hypothetical protein [Acetobacter sp. AN02]
MKKRDGRFPAYSGTGALLCASAAVFLGLMPCDASARHPSHAHRTHTPSASAASSAASGGVDGYGRPATSARPIEDQEGAPPPPDGYTPITDTDVTIQAFSSRVRAEKPADIAPPNAQQVTRLPGARQIDVLGVPVTVNAPVVPPYNGDFTYTTYGGQPGSGRNAPGAWGAAGEP